MSPPFSTQNLKMQPRLWVQRAPSLATKISVSGQTPPGRGAGSILKVGAQIPARSAGKIFLLCPPTFSWCPPMTGHYMKVQGTVRTGLGQRGRPYEAKAIFDFSVTLCQRWPSQSIEHEAWVVSYRFSTDTNSVSCSVSVIWHLNPQTYFWSI